MNPGLIIQCLAQTQQPLPSFNAMIQIVHNVVSASALTVHQVGRRTMMLVSASASTAMELDVGQDSDAGECFSSYSPWSWT